MKGICVYLVEDDVHDSLLVLSTTQHGNDQVMQTINCLRTCVMNGLCQFSYAAKFSLIYLVISVYYNNIHFAGSPI